MSKYIVHLGTGTVLVADECMVVDADELSTATNHIAADYVEDAIIDLAFLVGTSLKEKL